MSKKPLVSIIIVNWNGLEHLQLSLPALKTQTYKNFELIFVDNGSSDGSTSLVRKLFPKSKIVILNKNYGFALPNNRGLAAASGDYILTLNNDVILDPNFVDRIVSYISRQPLEVYAINPAMRYFDRPELINSAGINLLPNGMAINRFKNLPYESICDELVIDGCCAGCALFRKSSLDNLEYFFDESYFAYYEDVDLAIRFKLQQKIAKFYKGAVCYHKHGATSNKFPDFKLYLLERNRLRNLLKYYKWYKIIFEPVVSLYLVFRGLHVDGEGSISQVQKKFFQNPFKLVLIVMEARFKLIFEIRTLLQSRRKFWNKL